MLKFNASQPYARSATGNLIPDRMAALREDASESHIRQWLLIGFVTPNHIGAVDLMKFDPSSWTVVEAGLREEGKIADWSL